MHINITEQILADQQTLEYRTALEISRQFSDFIRKTAHEFRTPLSLIVTCLELYRIQADPDKRTRYIGQIDEQTRYLTRLTEQLNLLASMNREATLDISNVNCNQLAETAHTALHSKAKAKQIALSLELQPDLTLIDGDVYKLLFVLRELIENALRYSPSAAAVIVRTYDSASAVIIEVMDAGIGISAAHTQRIFEPYFKTDPSRALNNSGMGLGLTFVKKIIEMHHGRIEVESVLHQGSIFRLILPISLPSY